MLRYLSSNQYDMENQRDMDCNRDPSQENGPPINESILELPADMVEERSNLANETATMMRLLIHSSTRRISRINYNFNGQLGNTQPVLIDVENQQQATHIASPIDSVQSTITDLFSRSVTEYFPYPRESEGEQCTTPDPIPAININTHIGQRVINRINMQENYVDDNNIVETADTPTNTDLSNSNDNAVIVNSGVQEHPAELQHDIDFSTDPHEDPNRTNVDTSALDGRRLASEELRLNNHAVESNVMENMSEMTQAASTNDITNDQLTTTEHGTNERTQILADDNTPIMTEIKDVISPFSQTVSSEGTVSDEI